MNITAIVKDFQANANFSIDDEVALFRKLVKSICKYSNSTFINQTHGKVAQVEFTSMINGKDVCEISDLLIVSRNGRVKEYRATFWQAKKENAPKWPAPRGTSNFDFKAQFNQWELLSFRPQVKGLANFHPHPDILSKAKSPSIGSFGVFYEDQGVVEVNYSIAEMVLASSVSRHPKMVINERLSQYTLQNEAIVRSRLEAFLEALSAFMIGAAIDLNSSSGQWLNGYIAGKCRANNITDFMDYDGDDTPLRMTDSYDDGISILLINSEN